MCGWLSVDMRLDGGRSSRVGFQMIRPARCNIGQAAVVLFFSCLYFTVDMILDSGEIACKLGK